MSLTVHLTVPMLPNLVKLRFPKALEGRPDFLLDEQGRRGKLKPSEKKEAEAPVRMANMLSILKLVAQVETLRP